MAKKQSQIINTLGDVFQFMKPYAGGSIPDAEYANWKRWVQLGQQDAVNRGFWRRLLIPVSFQITAGDEDALLPDNFHKINGLYALDVNGVDWNQPNNSDGQTLYVFMDPETAKWKVKFKGFTPQTSVTATLWYFYNPPTPIDEIDPIHLDGEMIGFYALKEYFRKARQPGSLDDARIEYENRREELLSLEVIPSPQELLSWGSYSSYTNTNPTERQYYRGRYGRRRR